MEITKSNEEYINELAEDLALNHVRNSIIDKNNEGAEKVKKILELGKRDPNKSTRNIVILGSGCSYDAYSDLFPLGEKSVELIEKKLKFNFIQSPNTSTGDWSFTSQLNRKYQKIFERLHLKRNPEDRTFESRLTLMSYFFNSNEIRNEISQLFNYRTFPSYFYEIIAYLLKNRYIEGVINFNFDELLDQAIEEELGDGHLIKIISDGDCIPYSDMLTRQKMREPFYIKPHGTASYKSSLRFTKEQYLDIPDEIEGLMEEIFVGKTIYKNVTGLDDQENSQFDGLNLIIFGFAMESIEFHSVLKKAYERLKANNSKDFRIYYFSYCKYKAETKDDEKSIEYERDYLHSIFEKVVVIDDKDKKSKEDISKEVNAILEKEITIISLRDLEKSDPNPKKTVLERSALELCIDELLHNIYDKYRSKYKPNDAKRHRLMTQIFNSKKLKNTEGLHKEYTILKSKDYHRRRKNLYFNTSQYYLERVIFEITLVVLKNKGYIQPKESLKGINRVGHYYHLYYNSFDNSEDAKSIHTILFNMALNPYSISIANDIYRLESENWQQNDVDVLTEWLVQVENLEKEKDTQNRSCPDTKECVIRLFREFGPLLNEKIEIEGTSEIGTSTEKISRSLLSEIIQKDSLTLYPNFKDFQLNAFGHVDPINIIPSTTALKFRFLDHFIRGDWDVLLMTSDRGYDLLNALDYVQHDKWINFRNEKNISLILADIRLTQEDKIQKKIDELDKKFGIKIEISNLPFYDHNSHMKLFFKKKDGIKISDSESNLDYYIPTNAMYYYKKGFSNNINALHFRPQYNRKNILMLLDKYLSYYLKAENYETNMQSYLLHFKHSKKLKELLAEHPIMLSIRKSLEEKIGDE